MSTCPRSIADEHTTHQVPGITQLSSIQGGVYIKANIATRSAMVSEYSGSHRGVLVQFGVIELFAHVATPHRSLCLMLQMVIDSAGPLKASGVLSAGQQQIGHLPLGLFDAAKSAPPPPL